MFLLQGQPLRPEILARTGLKNGLPILAEVNKKFALPILVDVHESHEPALASAATSTTSPSGRWSQVDNQKKWSVFSRQLSVISKSPIPKSLIPNP